MFSLSIKMQNLVVKEMLNLRIYARCAFVRTTKQKTILPFLKKRMLKFSGTTNF